MLAMQGAGTLAFAGIGFTSFSFTLNGPGTREQAERLAHEVIQAVRAACQQGRPWPHQAVPFLSQGP
jgi:hypothetical protein